ncbi:MAG TPA: hypothetical protein VND64_22320 [Pirellulales bacterium]|nr:hypothetical protein [Pirellulales bacterium]
MEAPRQEGDQDAPPFDELRRLYIGGGNSRPIDFELPPDVEVISNDVGMREGIWLWRKDRPHAASEAVAE